MQGIIGFSFIEMWIEWRSVSVRMHCRRNAYHWAISVAPDIYPECCRCSEIDPGLRSVSRRLPSRQCDGHTVRGSVTTGCNDGMQRQCSGGSSAYPTSPSRIRSSTSPSLPLSPPLSSLLSLLICFSSSSPISHPLTTRPHTTRLCAFPPCPPSRAALAVIIWWWLCSGVRWL